MWSSGTDFTMGHNGLITLINPNLPSTGAKLFDLFKLILSMMVIYIY